MMMCLVPDCLHCAVMDALISLFRTETSHQVACNIGHSGFVLFAAIISDNTIDSGTNSIFPLCEGPDMRFAALPTNANLTYHTNIGFQWYFIRIT